jgi:hypothetical protein
VRTVDLAIYADALAGESAAVAARLERARSRLYQAAIERAACDDLPPETIERLRAIGLLSTRGDRAELHELDATLKALRQLQAWVEERLSASTAV